jgi:hypothetical protein
VAAENNTSPRVPNLPRYAIRHVEHFSLLSVGTTFHSSCDVSIYVYLSFFKVVFITHLNICHEYNITSGFIFVLVKYLVHGSQGSSVSIVTNLSAIRLRHSGSFPCGVRDFQNSPQCPNRPLGSTSIPFSCYWGLFSRDKAVGT